MRRHISTKFNSFFLSFSVFFSKRIRLEKMTLEPLLDGKMLFLYGKYVQEIRLSFSHMDQGITSTIFLKENKLIENFIL